MGRIVVLVVTAALALVFVAPAAGEPSDPVAESAGLKKDVKKAKKAAKRATKLARRALTDAGEALTVAQRAQQTADQALFQAGAANDLAAEARGIAVRAEEIAANAKAQADTNLSAIGAAQGSADTATSKANAAQAAANAARAKADANEAKLGCPFGASTRSSGICMNDSMRAADDYFAAEDDCEDEGRFLPSVGDLMHYLHKTDQDPGNGAITKEWTYERFETGTSEVVSLLSGYPQHTVEPTASNLPYRCVTHANG